MSSKNTEIAINGELLLTLRAEEDFTPVAAPTRIATQGPCELQMMHDAHLFPSNGEHSFDVFGCLMFWSCPGQYSACSNCDDRKCMDCVLRYWHDDCKDSCPMCC